MRGLYRTGDGSMQDERVHRRAGKEGDFFSNFVAAVGITVSGSQAVNQLATARHPVDPARRCGGLFRGRRFSAPGADMTVVYGIASIGNQERTPSSIVVPPGVLFPPATATLIRPASP